MRSTEYGPPPIEFPMEAITKDFEFRCDNYAVAYTFIQFLNQLYLCDHSGVLDDFVYKNGIPVSDWVVFFTCLPKDADRMTYVAKYIPYGSTITIKNEEGDTIWER